MLKGDEKPIWAAQAPTDPAQANEDDYTVEATPVVPVTWEHRSIETIVGDLRSDEPGYTFLLANFGGRVAGVRKWKFEALSGSKSPSQVLPASSEALLVLILLNYWKAWGAQANPTDQTTTDDSTQASSVSSITETSAATRCAKTNNGSTKDGWSVEGIRHFEALLMKVKEDRSSEDGKNFEANFQRLMKEKNRGARKRRHPSAAEQITSIQNDLSDVSASSDEEGNDMAFNVILMGVYHLNSSMKMASARNAQKRRS